MKRLLPIVGMLIVAALFLSPLLGLGRSITFLDFSAQSVPLWDWAHRTLAGGQPAAWCGDLMAGYPVGDEGQIGLAYWPTRFLLAWGGGVFTTAYFIYLHTVLAGIGTWFLARRLGLSGWASGLAALVMSFSGPMVSTWQMNDMASPAWYPWALLGLRLLCEGSVGGGVLLGLAVGLGFLGGHPSLWVYGCGLLPIFFWAWAKWESASLVRLTLGLAIALTFAVTLTAGQARRLSRYQALSVRAEPMTLEQSAVNSLRAASWLQLPAPFLFGNQADGSFLGAAWRGGSWMPQGLFVYLGFPIFFLAWAALFWQRSKAWPWAVGLALLVIYCFGDASPLFKLLQAHWPFNHLRAPMKALSMAGLFWGLCAGLGLDAVLEKEERLKILAKVLATGAVLLFSGFLILVIARTPLLRKAEASIQLRASQSTTLPSTYYLAKADRWIGSTGRHLGLQAAFLALWAGGLLLASLGNRRSWGLALALGALFLEYRVNAWAAWPTVDAAFYGEAPPTLKPLLALVASRPGRVYGVGRRILMPKARPAGLRVGDLAEERLIESLLADNFFLCFGLGSIHGYSPAGLARNSPLIRSHPDWFDFAYRGESEATQLETMRSYLDRGHTRWLMTAVPLKAPFLKRISDLEGGLSIYENPGSLPLARLSRAIHRAGDARSAFDLGLKLPATSDVVEQALDLDYRRPGRGTVTLVSQQNQRWEIQAKLDAPGLLVLSQVFYPATWQASVDDRPAEVLPVDGLFAGIYLKSGDHRVIYRYVDPVDAWDPPLRTVALLLGLGWLAFAFRRKKRL